VYFGQRRGSIFTGRITNEYHSLDIRHFKLEPSRFFETSRAIRLLTWRNIRN